MTGRRKFADPRNALHAEVTRLVRQLKPKILVVENVPGLVGGKMRLIFAEMHRGFQAAGYAVRAKMLNAAFLGVPQRRRRLFFIGVRKDLERGPAFPKPRSKPASFGETCWDLRGNLDGDRMLHPVVKVVAALQPNKWTTEERLKAVLAGNRGWWHSLCWASWHRCMGTLLKDETSWCGVVHPDRERYISLMEAKRVSSFPDEFWFPDRKTGIALMGNCVPPLMMKAVAKTLKDEVLSAAEGGGG